MMRSGSWWSIAFVGFTLTGGCAHHPGASGPYKRTGADPDPVAMRRTVAEYRARLHLDEIDPRITLARTPTTRAADEEPPIEAVRLYARARAAMLDDDQSAAAGFLAKAVALDPWSFDLHYELAQAYQSEGGSTAARALAEFEQAAALEPDHLDLQLNLGRQYLSRGNLDAGLTHLRLAAQTHEYASDAPGGAIVDFFLASALSRAGYDQAALDVYGRLIARLDSPSMALRMDPEAGLLLSHVDALRLERADLLMRQRDYDQAAQAYHAAVQRAPNSFDFRQREVHALTEARHFDEATEAAAEAVVRFHASGPAMALLRAVYRAAGHEGDAVSALARLHDRHPADRSILYALADVLRTEHRNAEAERVLAAAAAHRSDDIGIVRRRFAIRSDGHDLNGAARLLIQTAAEHPDLNEELTPLWSDLTRPSAAGRLRLPAMQSIDVPAAQRAAKYYWLSRVARSWHRDAIADRALAHAVDVKPLYPPAYREQLEAILTETDASAEQKAAAAQQLIERAAKAGDAPLSDELAGLLLMQRDQPAQAAKRFAEAIKGGDTSVDALLARADALRKTGDDKSYESLLWKAVSDHPTLNIPYLELYAYYVRHGAEPSAQRVLSEWFTADPHSPEAQELQARDDYRAGRADAGEAILARLLAEHWNDPSVLGSLQQFYVQTQHLDRFIKSLEQIRGNHPGADGWAASLSLASLYADENRIADATRVADTLRTAVSDDADALYVVAGLYNRLGQKEASERVLADVVRLDPDHAAACNDLGYAWADRGANLERAEQLIRRAVAAEPHNAGFLDSLGWVLYKRGRFAEARTCLDRAVGPAQALADSDPTVLDHRGDVLYRLGDPAAASADWHRAAERIASMQDDRRRGGADDLKALRLVLQAKQKQLAAGQPVAVAPIAERLSDERGK